MDRITLLRAYSRVIELGSFSAAAADLSVSQPTVSKWIAGLEEELGVSLLARTTRSRKVTEEGKRFYEKARALVESWDEAVASARSTTRVLRGQLRISVPVVFGQRHIVPLVPSFLAAHPELELDLRSSDRYVNLLEEGIDLAIRVGKAVEGEFPATLASTPRVLVASPGYIAFRGAPAGPPDLAAHDCLLQGGLRGGAWSFRQGTSKETVTVRGRVQADLCESVLSFARAGLGIALLPSWLVEAALAEGSLIPLLPAWEAPHASIRAITPPGRHGSALVQAFVAHLAEEYQRRFSRAAA